MEMDRTSGKRIIHYGNESYIKEMGRTSREVGRTRNCIVLRKWIVTDRKELGQQSESQARLPSAYLFFRVGFRVLLE